MKVASRIRNPAIKHASSQEKEREQRAFGILSTYPADSEKFLELMTWYLKSSFKEGNVKGGVWMLS